MASKSARQITLVNPSPRKHALGEQLHTYGKVDDVPYKGHIFVYSPVDRYWWIKKNGKTLGIAMSITAGKKWVTENFSGTLKNPKPRRKKPGIGYKGWRIIPSDDGKYFTLSTVVGGSYGHFPTLLAAKKEADRQNEAADYLARNIKNPKSRAKSIGSFTLKSTRASVKPVAAWIFSAVKKEGKVNIAIVEQALMDFLWHKTVLHKAP